MKPDRAPRARICAYREIPRPPKHSPRFASMPIFTPAIVTSSASASSCARSVAEGVACTSARPGWTAPSAPLSPPRHSNYAPRKFSGRQPRPRRRRDRILRWSAEWAACGLWCPNDLLRLLNCERPPREASVDKYAGAATSNELRRKLNRRPFRRFEHCRDFFDRYSGYIP